MILPFCISLHPLSCAKMQHWYMQHLPNYPACRRDAMHPDGHANSNTIWFHCIEVHYLAQLVQLAAVDVSTATRVLAGLSAIPLCAETLRRCAQKVRAGK